jgi:pimeloyl-ACP methyl ester carboxylesterase
MATITVNEVALYYTAGGTGPNLILVHGSWGDADNWKPVAPLLAKHCTVISYDRRGHSRSERPPTQGSAHEDVADLAALIEALDLAPAFICGSSYGALITLRLAATRSELVRGVVVHEPPGLALLFDDPALKPLAEAARQRLVSVQALLEAGEYPAAAERFVDTVAFGPGEWARLPAPVRQTFVRNAPTFLDELRDPDAFALDLDALATYRKPALLTHGDHSPPEFAPILDRIAAVLPQAERHLYTGAGHVPHLTHPADYARVTLERILR